MNNNMILRNYSSAPPLQTYPQYFQQPIAQPLYTLAVAAPTNYGLAPYYRKPTETTQYGGSPAPHAYPPAGILMSHPFRGNGVHPLQVGVASTHRGCPAVQHCNVE